LIRSARRWWFVDGRPIAAISADALFNHAFASNGPYPFSVLDEWRDAW
jgi:penicillin-binding protein 1C